MFRCEEVQYNVVVNVGNLELGVEDVTIELGESSEGMANRRVNGVPGTPHPVPTKQGSLYSTVSTL